MHVVWAAPITRSQLCTSPFSHPFRSSNMFSHRTGAQFSTRSLGVIHKVDVVEYMKTNDLSHTAE